MDEMDDTLADPHDIFKRLLESRDELRKQEAAAKATGTENAEAAANDSHAVVLGDDVSMKVAPAYIMTPPPPSMTGVSIFLTRLCATISADCYNPNNSVLDFTHNLSNGYVGDLGFPEGAVPPPVEVIRYANNGIFTNTNPPFAIVVTGHTLIIGIRGSSSLMDWDRDLAFFLGTSFRWNNCAKVVKVQGGYMALVENLMTDNEDLILQTVHDRNIKEVIWTGHSLAGGVASVGHMWCVGSINSEYHDVVYPKWEALKDKVTIRTMAFEAPMTTAYLQSGMSGDGAGGDFGFPQGEERYATANVVANKFIKECSSTMVNTCFNMDVIPTAYGIITPLLDVMDAVLANKPFANCIENKMYDIIASKVKMSSVIDDAKEALYTPYIKVCQSFQHIGKIIHYESMKADPVVYINDIKNNGLSIRSFYESNGEIAPPQFATLYKKYKEKLPQYNTSEELVNFIYYQHTAIVEGPGLSLGWQPCFQKHLNLVSAPSYEYHSN